MKTRTEMSRSKLNVLMITQEINPKGDVLGFVWTWVIEMSKYLGHLFVATYRVWNVKDKPLNVEFFQLARRRRIEEVERRKAEIKKYGTIPRRIASFMVIGLKLTPLILRLRLRRKLDVVFTHMNPEFVLVTAPICKLLGVPIVMWYAHVHVDLKLKLAHSLANKVVTSHEKDFRIKSKKLTIIGQGIDIPEISEMPKENLLISVGRVSRVKEYETMIKAFPRILEKIGDVKLRIVGPIYDEEYAQDLKRLTERLSLDNKVDFVGAVPHPSIGRLYSGSMLFIGSGRTGFDKTTLEAMAHGLPVVVCDDTFDELLSDLVVYCRYTPKDYDELAEKVISLLNDGKLRQEVGRKLRERVARTHGLNIFIKRLVNVMYNGVNVREVS